MISNSLAIFDLDGTLLDTSTSICNTLIATLTELKLPPLEKTKILEAIGMPLKDILSDLKLTNATESIVVSRFREHLLNNIKDGVNTFPGVVPLINELERNSVDLAIATSKPTFLAKETVKYSELSRYNFTILGSDGLKPKPNPEVIQKVMIQHPGVKNVVMFGDRAEDMLAAKAAGIRSVGVAQSAHSMDELSKAGAHLTFRSFLEVNKEHKRVIELFSTTRHVP